MVSCPPEKQFNKTNVPLPFQIDCFFSIYYLFLGSTLTFSFLTGGYLKCVDFSYSNALFLMRKESVTSSYVYTMKFSFRPIARILTSSVCIYYPVSLQIFGTKSSEIVR